MPTIRTIRHGSGFVEWAAAMATEIEIVDSLDAVPEAAWNGIAGNDPFASHGFLSLLQRTGSAVAQTGWSPCHVLLKEDGILCGAIMAYLKTHSRGEFVFDQGWAEAYARHGLDYYPKLVACVPFTPVSGPRILAAEARHQRLLVRALMALGRQTRASSIHVLFAHSQDRAILAEEGFMTRVGIQFHWRNAAHGSFDEFLATLTQEKRKKLRQDRKRVASAGVGFRWLEGADLGEEELRFFYRCHQATYDRHWGQPYLPLDFFLRLHRQHPERMLLVLAHRDGEPLACALNIKGDGVLYGRYWGTLEFVPGLHFETCYAQSIEYCIRHRYRIFEGGAQGGHKMARGMLPVKTYSAHWIADPRFATAVADFLARETAAVADHVEALQDSSPYRRDRPGDEQLRPA